MTLEEMLSRISSRELTEWMIYETGHPFSNEANSFGHAVTATVIANKLRKQGDKPFKVEEFMPRVEKDQSVAEQLQIAEMLTVGLGGVDLRKDEIDG